MGRVFLFKLMQATSCRAEMNNRQCSDKPTLRVSGASEVCLAPSGGLTTLSSRVDAAVKAALLPDGGNGEIINCYSPQCVYVFRCVFVCVCIYRYIYKYIYTHAHIYVVLLSVCSGVSLCVHQIAITVLAVTGK